MPGKRYLLDTNALTALLEGSRELVALTQSADWLGVQSSMCWSFWDLMG